jgi:hypothetical protein
MFEKELILGQQKIWKTRKLRVHKNTKKAGDFSR